MTTTSEWDKFLLLLWKNWIIQKRHYMQTAFEITIPVLACSLLILVRGLVTPKTYSEPTIYPAQNVTSLAHIREMVSNHPIELTILYTPNNTLLRHIVARAARTLGTDVRYLGFNNSEIMYNELITNNYLAGVEFDAALEHNATMPDNLTFSLRFPSEMRTATLPGAQFWANWRTFLVFPPFQTYGARMVNASDGGYPANYYAEGFASVQNAISRAILYAKNASSDLPEVSLRRFPYPPFYDDVLLRGLENLFPVIIMVAFFYSCINTVKYITLEKEKQLKETMKIMGLGSWLHWAAWFVRTLALMMVSITLITVLLSVSLTTNTTVAIFQFSSRPLIWVFLFIYSITTIAFCFMVSTFFSKANIASGAAGIIWFYSLTPFQLTFGNYDRMTLGAKLGSSLWCNTAMGYGVMLLMKHEGTSVGLQWHNVLEPVTVDDTLTMGHIFGMLLTDALIYFAVALYVEQVAPGKYGTPQRWNFLFARKFWRASIKDADAVEQELLHGTGSQHFEEEPIDKAKGIEIRKLRKTFRHKRTAVNDLSVNFFEDQISVLLGHNGAGKTTTMSMLTGMLAPTAGTAIIGGYDIRHDMAALRNCLGLCPQHNVLFNELTVAEHIRFFAKLKGLSRSEADDEVRKYTKALELEDKVNAQSFTLSGGMKRKLSMAIALCGGSRIVFCDEPTSGMDPSARRVLWDLLEREKAGRTIILSTHFMDEADVLGDRVAIMADGTLRAVGSPFFLKKRFGSGYRLVCVKQSQCNPNALTALLRKYIPSVTVESDVGQELSYTLDEAYLGCFQTMLEDLENNSEACGISSYGIALSTLEEVFMRLGSDDSMKYDVAANGTQNGNNGQTYNLLDGQLLLCNQISALFAKKYLSFIRAWKISILQTILPMCFVFLVVAIVRFFPNNVVLPPLEVSFGMFDKTTTVLETNNPNSAIARSYQSLFQQFAPSNTLATINGSFSAYILEKSKQNIKLVDNGYMVGATLDTVHRNYTAWFNNKAYHTAPLSLNLIYNALLRTFCPGCTLSVVNKPLPYSSQVRFLRTQSSSNLGFQLAFNTGFAMAFVAAMYILFCIKERASGSKLLQFVSGANVVTFWTVSFVWDFLVYVLGVALYIGALAMFQEDGWRTGTELGRVTLVLLLFGMAVIPFTYLCSFLFDVPSTGFIKMIIFNIFTGTVIFTAVFLLKVKDFDLKPIAETMEWFYLVFPLFALSHSLNNINVVETTRQICQAQCEATPFCTEKLMCKINALCCDTEIFSFGAQGINRNLLYMLLVAIGSFVLLLLIDYRMFRCCMRRKAHWNCRRHDIASSEEALAFGEDSDVADERVRILGLGTEQLQQHNLVLREVSKWYGPLLAVNRLTLAVNRYECFGLLGVNGAGKTTTFKMLTGDENFSTGEGWTVGINMAAGMNDIYRKIGYCPQFDALLEDLTGMETLVVFALLRGLPMAQTVAASRALARELNFDEHLRKLVKTYSGGTKRKLSTALALIGDPAVIYLDEPTTGMDPAARRHFWNAMCKVRAHGKTVILTSHSMEECEALCTRLGIMVNGEFCCLGSAQHLKNKFSQGYFLTIKLKLTEEATLRETRKRLVKSFIKEHFSGSKLRQECKGYLTYHITGTTMKWSAMFGVMEQARHRLNIEDYALGQTSLEQVFLSLTAFQRAAD